MFTSLDVHTQTSNFTPKDRPSAYVGTRLDHWRLDWRWSPHTQSAPGGPPTCEFLIYSPNVDTNFSLQRAVDHSWRALVSSTLSFPARNAYVFLQLVEQAREEEEKRARLNTLSPPVSISS